MKSVFVDTSAFVALFYEKDKHHEAAREMLGRVKKANASMVLTDYVFDETITGIMTSVGHLTAIKAGEYILGSRLLKLIWLDEALKLRAWELFKRYDDKAFSFTDCTSFLLMKEFNVTRYLAFDRHFQQAGFAPFA